MLIECATQFLTCAQQTLAQSARFERKGVPFVLEDGEQ